MAFMFVVLKMLVRRVLNAIFLTSIEQVCCFFRSALKSSTCSYMGQGSFLSISEAWDMGICISSTSSYLGRGSFFYINKPWEMGIWISSSGQ